MASAATLPYPDTSFLIALYGSDVFTARARAEVVSLRSALRLTDLNVAEYRNALRLLHFRKLVTAREVSARLAAFQQDQKSGLLRRQELDWPKVWQGAESLSERTTAKGGHRLVDLLHVAAAQSLGAQRFLSFDDRQRELAGQQGLRMNPLT